MSTAPVKQRRPGSSRHPEDCQARFSGLLPLATSMLLHEGKSGKGVCVPFGSPKAPVFDRPAGSLVRPDSQGFRRSRGRGDAAHNRGQFCPGYPPLRLPRGASLWLPGIQPWINPNCPQSWTGPERTVCSATVGGCTSWVPGGHEQPPHAQTARSRRTKRFHASADDTKSPFMSRPGAGMTHRSFARSWVRCSTMRPYTGAQTSARNEYARPTKANAVVVWSIGSASDEMPAPMTSPEIRNAQRNRG